MAVNYSYITDFHKSRAVKIGASDIPKLIPNPDRPMESLAAWTDGHGKRHTETALDLYNEKINGKPSEYSFPAEMGHYLEGKALREFIADNILVQTADDFFRGYMLHKLEQDKQGSAVNPLPFNNTPFKHNTEANTDYGVAHADCLYDADRCGVVIKKSGLIIDLSKPFLIEAKSARLYSVSARKKSPYIGYDLGLKEWQGVPLKVYFQCQYQMVLYNVDTVFVSLIFDTSEKYYWQIKANKKHQADLVQIAEYMKKCIDTRTPPKQLAMNAKDIQKLYPEIKEDFKEVQGSELSEVLNTVRTYREATEQEKNWKQKKEDAESSIAIHLQDAGKISGIIGGSMVDIAKWKNTGGGERLAGLDAISKRDDGKRLLNYLRKNGLIKTSESSRKPSIIIKQKEMEAVEL